MYKCLNCGGDLKFDPKSQKLECSHCDCKFEPNEFKEKKNVVAEETNNEGVDETFEAIIYKCPQCGAQLLATDETGATFCNYCGSSVILETKISKQKIPKYVIPFKKTKEECEQAYRQKLKNFLFAPKNMYEEEQIEKLRGIYMPYWIYTLEKKGEVELPGTRKYRRGDYIYIETYKLITNVDIGYKGIAFDASSNFYDELSQMIAPYNMEDAKEFFDAYLSGFYADVGDVDPKIYYDNAQKTIAEDLRKRIVKTDYTYSKYNVQVPSGIIDIQSSELGFFPVWFLASKNKKGDRISYTVINGQTGKVAAEIPIDFKKYTITSILFALPIYAILNMAITLTPIKTSILTIVLAIICLFISNSQLNKLNRKNLKIDDEGYVYKNKNEIHKKMPFNEKVKVLKYPILAVLIIAIIWFIRPVADIYYYIATLISAIFIFKAFWDIIKLYNLLNSRKIPQLEKRGGDE